MRQDRQAVRRGRKRLPRCRCGKAAYPTRVDAGRDRDRFKLARIYECDDGGIHLTKIPKNAPKAKSTHPRRSKVSTIEEPAVCPLCHTAGPQPEEDTVTCAHPLHWPDRDPAQPYYPDVIAQVVGETSNVFMGAGRIVKALRRARVPEDVVTAFSADLRASEDYAAALNCMTRWVVLA